MFQTVLLIDRDEPSVRLARAVLEGDGWRVLHSPDLAHARAVLSHIRPDLIVTALVATDLEAIGHARELAALASGVPVVAVTALNGPETEHRVRQAGCAGFLRKPISIDTFSSQLRSHVGAQP